MPVIGFANDNTMAKECSFDRIWGLGWGGVGVDRIGWGGLAGVVAGAGQGGVEVAGAGNVQPRQTQK